MGSYDTWEGTDAEGWRNLLGVPDVQLNATIGSTNDVARTLAEAGAASFTIVIADHQTSGRGRGGRSWRSQPGSSLLCSIIFRVEQKADSAPGTAPVRIGHAVARAIADVAQVDARVKWPNDVVIPEHGKVAGTLCEAVMRQGTAFVIAGIGVNVHAPGGDYPAINQIARTPVQRGALLKAIVAALKPLAASLIAPLTDDELAQIRERDILLGQMVEDDSGTTGTARGITPDGSLLVETATATIAVHNATIRLAGTHAYPGARA